MFLYILKLNTLFQRCVKYLSGKDILPFLVKTPNITSKLSKTDINKAPKLFSGFYNEEEILTPMLNHLGFS